MSPSTDSTPLNLRSPHRPIHAGVILLGGETELLDIAPIEILQGMSKDFINGFPDGMLTAEMKRQAFEVVVHYVAEKGGMAKLTSGMSVAVTDTFESCPPLDVTLIGATIAQYQPTPVELQFLRDTFNSPTNQAFLNICAGMMPPLQAGLLKNRRATGPLPMLPMLRKIAPDTEWTEKRWEQDGKLWTSGTLLNGLDMMRAWVESVWGAAENGEYEKGVANGKGDGKEANGDKNGKGGERLADFVLGFGGWPERSAEYTDVGSEGRWARVSFPFAG